MPHQLSGPQVRCNCGCNAIVTIDGFGNTPSQVVVIDGQRIRIFFNKPECERRWESINKMTDENQSELPLAG